MVESEFEQYRGLFVAESRENHEVIVRNLLILEGGEDTGAIDEIFRAAHTLKGASASMGFDTMEHLCHAMEDVFQAIRNNELTVTQALMDLLLSTVDIIEEQIDEIEEGGDGSSVNVDDMVDSLRLATGNGKKEEPPKESTVRETYAPPSLDSINGYPQYTIRIEIDESSLMKDVRALIAIGNIEQFGTILGTNPPLSQLEDEDAPFDGILSIVIESDAGIEALRSAASGTEVADVSVEEIVTQGSTEEQADTQNLPLYQMIISVDEESADRKSVV